MYGEIQRIADSKLSNLSREDTGLNLGLTIKAKGKLWASRANSWLLVGRWPKLYVMWGSLG